MNQQQINIKTESIRGYIREGKIKESLNELDQFIRDINDVRIDNDFLLLSAQYHQEEKLFSLNLSNAPEIKNKITYGIIQLMTEAREAASKKIINRPGYHFEKSSRQLFGHCIRTGVEIPFDMDKPLSWNAFNTWRQFEDIYYPEKYCHFSGEPSFGDTCFISPVLNKNWQKARREHGF